MLKRIVATLVVCRVAVAVTGCIDYSSYQDARIVERGQSQGTVAASISTYPQEGGDAVWFPIEVNPRWGIARRFDAAFRMSLLLSREEEFGMLVVGGDVRAGIISNHLALTLPVSIAVGDYIFASTNIQPGFIVTLPVFDDLDVNGAVRASVYVHSDMPHNVTWLYNVGLGIAVAPGWRVRPEVGWMVWENFDEERITYSQFGIGVTRTVTPDSPPAPSVDR